MGVIRIALRRWPVLALILLSIGLAVGLLVRFRGSDDPSATPPDAARVVWAFEASKRGAILSSPLVAGDRVYVAALHDTAFTNAGAVYCLDQATGKQLWRFDDGGSMQHTFSSPCLADGRLYVGEGMHANFTCKLYCLDAATGRKSWDFTAEGHIESSPRVAGGKVFFGAGDDGIYCLDARSGQKLWRFAGPFHVDSNPAVFGGRLYAGSGVSRAKRQTEAWCLDTETGKVLWRFPTNLPVWGSPAVSGDDVFFGLGNGRLLTGPEPPEKPAGGLICLTSGAGLFRWRYDVGDAVMGRAAVGRGRVYFGARDGACYCLDRRTGQLCWKLDLGSPVVASPALVGGRLYVIASAGRVCCLDADSGRVGWTFDVAGHSRTSPQLLSSPAVVAVPGENGAGNRVYFGSELRNATSSGAVLYCLGE